MAYSTNQCLEISHINYPDSPSVPLVCQVHLLPCLLQLNRIDPFVVARGTNIVEMIIYTRTACTTRLVGKWQSLVVAPVVVSPYQRNLIWDAQALLEVPSNFLRLCLA